MRPALRILLLCAAVFAAADAAAAVGWLPGGTVSALIRQAHAAWPITTVAGYLAVAAVGYWHFFLQQQTRT